MHIVIVYYLHDVTLYYELNEYFVMFVCIGSIQMWRVLIYSDEGVQIDGVTKMVKVQCIISLETLRFHLVCTAILIGVIILINDDTSFNAHICILIVTVAF